MTTISLPSSSEKPKPVELHTGDLMSREEFHQAYKQTPPGFKAELIGGMVFVASPLKTDHGAPHASLIAAFVTYTAGTSGTQCADNVTILLGDGAEPQPDIYLRLLPEFGGQSGVSKDGYISGPPELLAEVALSSRAIDLHAKRLDYQRNGVREYLVASVAEKELRWFDLRDDRELSADTDRIVRVRCFPGLWIDENALFSGDNARLLATLQRGLASPEHDEFVRLLASKRKP